MNQKGIQKETNIDNNTVASQRFFGHKLYWNYEPTVIALQNMFRVNCVFQETNRSNYLPKYPFLTKTKRNYFKNYIYIYIYIYIYSGRIWVLCGKYYWSKLHPNWKSSLNYFVNQIYEFQLCWKYYNLVIRWFTGHWSYNTSKI